MPKNKRQTDKMLRRIRIVKNPELAKKLIETPKKRLIPINRNTAFLSDNPRKTNL